MANGRGFFEKNFYFGMAWLIAAVVVYGFSHTIGDNLFHPSIARPKILYGHAVLFSSWVVFFILQTGLVRVRKVQWHRSLGWLGVALGVAIPIVGAATAVTMSRFNLLHGRDAQAAQNMAIPFFDITAFSVVFALAVYWRRKPEFHRRLMLVATCVLTAAAFGRFPEKILPPVWFYAGVDALIFVAVLRDLFVVRKLHRVYLYGLPAIAFGHFATMYTVTHASPWWMHIARALLG